MGENQDAARTVFWWHLFCIFFDYSVNVFVKMYDASSNKMAKQRQTPVVFSYLVQGIRSKSKLFDQGLYFVLRNKRL